MEMNLNDAALKYIKHQLLQNKYSDVEHAFSKSEHSEIASKSYTFFKISVISRLNLSAEEIETLNDNSLRSLYRRIKIKSKGGHKVSKINQRSNSTSSDDGFETFRSVIEDEKRSQKSNLIIKRVTKEEE